MKYVIRILATPFVFMVILIAHIYHAFVRTWLFLRYGGEMLAYSKNTKPTILDTYAKVCEMVKNQEDLKGVAKDPAFILKKVSQESSSRWGC